MLGQRLSVEMIQQATRVMKTLWRNQNALKNSGGGKRILAESKGKAIRVSPPPRSWPFIWFLVVPNKKGIGKNTNCKKIATAGISKAWERKESKVSFQVIIFDAQGWVLVKILVSSPSQPLGSARKRRLNTRTVMKYEIHAKSYQLWVNKVDVYSWKV